LVRRQNQEKAKPRELKLVEETELRKSLEEAKKAREKWEKEEGRREEMRKEKVKTKEDPFTKIVAPLTLENGIMISSIKELQEVLELLDEEIFKIHVNENKNDIADWVESKVENKEMANKLRNMKTKEEMLNLLKTFKGEKEKEGKAEEKGKKKEERG
jgi:hypothetical protein